MDDFKRLLYVFAVVCQKYKKFFRIEQQIFQIFDKMEDGAICRAGLPKRLQSPKYSKDIIGDCFLTVVFIQV